MFTALRRRLPRLGRFPRLCLIGVCLLLALDSAATQAAGRRRTAPPATEPVVVATHLLAVGHVVAPSDVAIVRWPRSLCPASARGDPRAVLGRRLTGPLARGEPVTATRLLGPDLARGLPAGLVAAAVPLADPRGADLVQPGDRVDLLATPRAEEVDGTALPGAVTTIARRAPALTVFAADSEAAAEIVLAVPRSAAVAISRAAPTRLFTVVLSPP